MYLILEEEIEGRCGDILGIQYHAIHIGWVPDWDAMQKMDEEFFGYKFHGVRDNLVESDIRWEFDRLHQKWGKVE